MISSLFTPFTLNRLALPNRWVMPAMQRGMCREGKPSAELAAYYRRRAEGGVGLIIGESAAIDHSSSTVQPTSAHINAATRDGWARCVGEVGEAGGAMLLQLWHEGALRTDGQALSPSGLAHPGRTSGRAATLAELMEIRDGFVRSALIAKDIGAAGIEVHAAHVHQRRADGDKPVRPVRRRAGQGNRQVDRQGRRELRREHPGAIAGCGSRLKRSQAPIITGVPTRVAANSCEANLCGSRTQPCDAG